MLTKIMQKTGKTELDLPLLFDPGESWAYGASTRVLGNVIEAVSGQKLDEFLQARILEPLGMHDTSYLVPAAKYPRVVAVNARGTDGTFVERPMPATLPASVAGDGGLYGTVSDYGLFLRMLLNRGKLGEHRILTEKSAKAMLENQTGKVVVQPQESAIIALKNFPGRRQGPMGPRLSARRRAVAEPRSRGRGHGPVSSTRLLSIRSGDRRVVMMQNAVLRRGVDAGYAGIEEAVYGNLK
jgi:CubicO group peptidase (beta-lactamase class C family)